MKLSTKKIDNKIRISSAIALTMSILLSVSTLGIAMYALFYTNKVLLIYGDMSGQISILQDSLQRLVLAFLVFGMLAAYFLTKLITNPLTGLVEGTKELAKGNLKYRFKNSKYSEVNTLVETYNAMAENLESLYNDLDKKVKERTKELENANKELKSTQAMVVHSEKMRSLGELVAGITHEINNPVNFIHGNMVHLKNYSNALIQIISAYEEMESELSEAQRNKLSELKEELEYDFIKEDLPDLIESCHEGTTRTKNIILDLKNFSRLDEMVVNQIDLPKEIDTTLNILYNKIKHKAEIVKDYEQNLPYIEGYGGQLNQVFMNILDNACYAIEEKGTITIRIHKQDENVIVQFEDTGCGMTEEQTHKIFDPFFTTKPVGEGTGLGLSISYKVIQRHQGTISVSSEVGKGTCFTICLPIILKQKENN